MDLFLGISLFHGIFEVVVKFIEKIGFMSQSLFDFPVIKDVFKIGPIFLAAKPIINHVLRIQNFFL